MLNSSAGAITVTPYAASVACAWVSRCLTSWVARKSAFPLAAAATMGASFTWTICAACKTAALVGLVIMGEIRSTSMVKEGSATGAFLVRFRFVSAITRSLIVSVTLPSMPLRSRRRAGPVGENAAAYRTLLSRKILLAGFGDTIGFFEEVSPDLPA